MPRTSANIVTALIAVVGYALTGVVWRVVDQPAMAAVLAVATTILAGSPRLINEWERGIRLRLGRFHSVMRPGITWVVPGIDRVTSTVDMRIRSTAFSAEKTLTHDTVPVNVDAVLFWVVTDAEKAILEVERYLETVSWTAQTTLRDVIGKADLVRMIADRRSLDDELRTIIDARTTEWGITVQSVEIRDVRIPGGLEDAMSRKAQADREKEARIILAEAETAVANEIVEAARRYKGEREAMRLRAMNMTYESIKERGALMVVPSTMTQSFAGEVYGLAAQGVRLEPGNQ